jgi:hypothetical protein
MTARLNGGMPPVVNGSGYGDSDVAAREAEFREQMAAVEETARAWGVRPESLEGRFVSALLGMIGWSGRVSAAAQEELKALLREQRQATEQELTTARELAKAARHALHEADIMRTVAENEKDKLVGKMVEETLPLFAERLKDALIIREKAWNDGVKRRRFAVALLAGFGLFAFAYGTHVWQTWMATSAYDWCATHPLVSGGRTYCDMTAYAQSRASDAR